MLKNMQLRMSAWFLRKKERWALATLVGNVEEFDRLVAQRIQALSVPIDNYTQNVSSGEMTASVQTCALIWTLCEKLKPRRMLDTGSGFSSWVLRTVAESSGHDSVVWSVDDDQLWLAKTIEFCRHQGLGDDGRMITWETFVVSDEGGFDLILHDLGNRHTRFDTLPTVLDRLSPQGIVILDDFHKHNYRRKAVPMLESRGYVVTPLLNHTLDTFGRYAALARRRD